MQLKTAWEVSKLRKRIISWLLVISIISAYCNMDLHSSRGDTSLLTWRKSDTMDASLQLIRNKAGEDDILLQTSMNLAGSYELVYYLEDYRRTTVSFVQQYDKLTFYYKVDDIRQTPNTNITQSLVNMAYLEMDYNATVPDWKFISSKTVDPATGALKFTIDKNASSRYNGVAFQISDKRVYVAWDFQTGVLYYQIIGYKGGQIMPVTMTNSVGETQTMKILKGLEGFNVKATHLVKNPSGSGNVELTPLTSPGGELPGSRPGVEITFKQPKELDTTDWTYKSSLTNFSNIKAVIELSDINSNAYLDFNFNMQSNSPSTSGLIQNLPMAGAGEVNSGVKYKYDPASELYTVQVVKDKSELNSKDEIIQWSELAASKIYNASIGFQIESGNTDYQFTQYSPESKFAYTYMAYELKRANMTEAYLDIKPYDVDSEEIEYSILYSKVILPQLDINDDLWVKHYYKKQGSTDNINIPVPFKQASTQDVYQVVINFAGSNIKSQVLNYRAEADNNVPPTTPKIKSIDNLYVVPLSEENTEPSKIQFDITWTAPDNRSVMELDTVFKNDDGDSSNDNIYYELLVNEVPNDSSGNPFSVIKIFQLSKVDGKYVLKEYNDGAGPYQESFGGEIAASDINFKDGYDMVNQLLRMNNVTIYENQLWTHSYKTAYLNGEAPTIVDNGSYQFMFPGINYLRIRAIAEIDGKKGISYLSVPMSLSLSLSSIDVPIVSGIEYKPLTGDVNDPVGVEVNFRPAEVQSYSDHMLVPIGKKINGLTYQVYITKSKDKMVSLEPIDPDDAVDPANPKVSDSYIKIPTTDTNKVLLTDTEINQLRNNEVLYFDVESTTNINTTISAIINNLEKNTNYYVRIVTQLTVSNIDGTQIEHRISGASDMLSITTPLRPGKPDDKDISPLAVENLKVSDYDTSGIIAKVAWDYPKELVFEPNKYAFEILAIEDRTLPSHLNGSGVSLDELIQLKQTTFASDFVKVWRLTRTAGGYVLMEYNFQTGTWVDVSDEIITIENNHIEIVDGNNKPNKVYYYYVRTVNISEGSQGAASVWQMDAYTTSPVKGPINLAVVYNSGYAYNNKNESIIQFDAPIPMNSDLVNDYRIEIHVMGEADSDYTFTKYPVTLLKQSEDGPLGYTRYVYKISGLKSGGAYSIKVRIEDRTQQPEVLPGNVLAYPTSPFSERIIIRTEFDQVDYDKALKMQQYLEYYDNKTKTLLQASYFQLESTADKNVILYRDSYALGTLAQNANGQFTLYAKDVKTNVYYLSSQFITQLNSKKVTLVMENKDLGLMIRPDSIGKDITPEINKKLDEIRQYSSNVVDYYVKVTVEAVSSTDKIQMVTPASKLVTVKVEIVGSKQIEANLDAMIIAEINNVIAWRRNVLQTSLLNELSKGINDQNLLKLADDAVLDASNNARFASNTVLLSNLQGTALNVPKLNKSYTLTLKPLSMATSLTGVKKINSQWNTQAVNYYNSKYTAETVDLTTYALIPKEMGANDLSNIYTPIQLDVINKYQLADIFTSTELGSTKTVLEKYRFIPVMAKLLGAPLGSQDITYLQNQGIQVTQTNLYGTLYRQEILYVYTQVFAKKYSIVLDSTKIRDYNLILDINSVDSAYRQTILIGANLGMFPLTNGSLNPKTTMTVKEFIELITKMDQGLNW